MAKAIMSNKASPEIITNYTKIVLKNRLEILPSIKTENYQEYERLRPVYKEILKAANQYYDFIFVDLNKGLDNENTREILEMSDLIIVNLTQRLKIINEFMDLRQNNLLFKQNNVLLLVGRYDKYSKYNTKNIARYMREKNVLTVPYNTLFFEAANEGEVADFFIKYRTIDDGDRNSLFISEIRRATEGIIYKLQEQLMRN